MSELKSGILTKAIAGFYYIEAGLSVYECKARGLFRKENTTPLVGDICDFTTDNNQKGFVNKIHPRINQLQRPPLANIDKLFIVASGVSPVFNPLVIDRLIAIAENKEIEPILVINKIDLFDPSEIIDIYKKVGIKIFSVCCKTAEGIDCLRKELSSGINVFTGNTGVGKSSILNLICHDLALKTGEISEKLGRGRHTTRHVELFRFNGGYIADTPGFSSLDTEKSEFICKENLQFAFREFLPYIQDCKFTSCSHTSEKGCEVCKAVEKGIISKSRHDSYVAMYNEVKEVKDWQQKK